VVPILWLQGGASDLAYQDTLTELPVQEFALGEDYALILGDSLEVLPQFPVDHFDMIFADPPYLLSNNGITCHAGKMVSVNKGEWDRSQGAEKDHEFVVEWLGACQRVLKPNGTIWVSGTHHIIYSVGYAMQQLGYKILNDIVWQKTNPPPNLSCRYFTHSTEIVLWAAKSAKSKHTFNYELMKEIAGGKQMKSVWRIGAAGKDEKQFAKHPTQKPLALLQRIILASTQPGDLLLDPFVGSGTTIVAALREGRRCIGIDSAREYLEIASRRIETEIGVPTLKGLSGSQA